MSAKRPSRKVWLLLAGCTLISSAVAAFVMRPQLSARAPGGASQPHAHETTPPPGMKWIPAGTFTMGTSDELSMPNERPAHQVHVDGFWMDEQPVTNAQFAVFVKSRVGVRGARWQAQPPLHLGGRSAR